MSLINCPECNKEISDTAVNCPNCGYKIGKMKFCKFCGEKIHEDSIICTKCGRQVEEVKKTASEGIIINNNNNNNNSSSSSSSASSSATASVSRNRDVIFVGNEKNKWVSLMLCIFLGWMGAHKFYEGKTLMGIIYLFTVGLFGIGWIIDIISIALKPNPYFV